MSNNNSALQAPGGHPDHQDPRGSKDRDEIRLPKEVILAVDGSKRSLGVSPQLAAKRTLVSTTGKNHKPINNTSTSNRPRLLHTQKVDADLPHLTPNESGAPGNEPAAGPAITKSAHIERAKAHTGMHICSAVHSSRSSNIHRRRSMPGQTVRHDTRTHLMEDK